MLLGKIPENASKTHTAVVKIINEHRPNHKIFCEYKVSRLLLGYWEKNNILPEFRDPALLAASRKLHFDIFDSTYNMIIEIQGSQHRVYNSFFHNDIGGLDRQRKNDSIKKRVCVETETKLIELSAEDQITEQMIINLYK